MRTVSHISTIVQFLCGLKAYTSSTSQNFQTDSILLQIKSNKAKKQTDMDSSETSDSAEKNKGKTIRSLFKLVVFLLFIAFLSYVRLHAYMLEVSPEQERLGYVWVSFWFSASILSMTVKIWFLNSLISSLLCPWRKGHSNFSLLISIARFFTACFAFGLVAAIDVALVRYHLVPDISVPH